MAHVNFPVDTQSLSVKEGSRSSRNVKGHAKAEVDPHEPPMPPKIKGRQAVHFAKSLLRGQPERMKIATTIAEDRVRELV